MAKGSILKEKPATQTAQNIIQFFLQTTSVARVQPLIHKHLFLNKVFIQEHHHRCVREGTKYFSVFIYGSLKLFYMNESDLSSLAVSV